MLKKLDDSNSLYYYNPITSGRFPAIHYPGVGKQHLRFINFEISNNTNDYLFVYLGILNNIEINRITTLGYERNYSYVYNNFGLFWFISDNKQVISRYEK